MADEVKKVKLLLRRGQKQELTNLAGDVLELWIGQQRNNSTADDFIYKVYKADLAIN